MSFADQFHNAVSQCFGWMKPKQLSLGENLKQALDAGNICCFVDTVRNARGNSNLARDIDVAVTEGLERGKLNEVARSIIALCEPSTARYLPSSVFEMLGSRFPQTGVYREKLSLLDAIDQTLKGIADPKLQKTFRSAFETGRRIAGYPRPVMVSDVAAKSTPQP